MKIIEKIKRFIIFMKTPSEYTQEDEGGEGDKNQKGVNKNDRTN